MDSKENCPDNLIIANRALALQNKENKKLTEQNEKLTEDLVAADNELTIQHQEIVFTEEQMEFDRHNLDALINNTNDLMWSVDTNFRLITSNKPFDDMVVLMSGKAIKKGNTILSAEFSPEQLVKYKASYERAFAGDIFMEIEHHTIPADIWSEISYYPITNGDEIVGTACHSRNITARKHAELEHGKIENDLIKRNEDLMQFAHLVSHNLRGPIACILGATRVFNDLELSSEEKSTIANGINESAMKLDEVVNDLNRILRVR